MGSIAHVIRTQFQAGDEVRDAGLITPPSIERFDDIAYGPDDVWQKLDVYRPRERASAVSPTAPVQLPVIVSIHGGGWVYGDKERYQWYCMDLATRGFVVVNFSYRLAPEFKFPASMEDTCAVFAWTVEHIAEYGGNPEQVFAVGDSAGGHMLGLFCNMCTNPSFAQLFDFSAPKDFVPKAVGLNCGAYIIKKSDDPTDLTSSLMADYLPEGGSEQELAQVNVIPHLTENFPPAFIMTCDGDFLHDVAYPLDARLRELKVPHELHVYAGLEEPLPHVFHCNMRSIEGSYCNDDECRFFRRFL